MASSLFYATFICQTKALKTRQYTYLSLSSAFGKFPIAGRTLILTKAILKSSRALCEKEYVNYCTL